MNILGLIKISLKYNDQLFLIIQFQLQQETRLKIIFKSEKLAKMKFIAFDLIQIKYYHQKLNLQNQKMSQ